MSDKSLREAVEALEGWMPGDEQGEMKTGPCIEKRWIKRDEVLAILSVPEPSREEHTTRLLCDAPFDDDIWRCEVCGDEWVFTEGTPEENHMNYCHRCGRKIIEIVRSKPEEEDDDE